MDVVSLVFGILAAVEAPFLAYGIYKILNYLVTRYRIKHGYVFGRIIMPNNREKLALAKPKGDEITIKGKKFQYNQKLLTYSGSKPIATYDSKKMGQLDLLTDLEKEQLTTEEMNILVTRSFNLGMIAGTNITKKLSQMLAIIMIASVAAVVISLYNVAILQGIDQNIAHLPDVITSTIQMAMSVSTNIPTG